MLTSKNIEGEIKIDIRSIQNVSTSIPYICQNIKRINNIKK